MKIYYNQTDITKAVSVHACQITDTAGGEADWASISFSDTEDRWSGWGPQRNDKLQIDTGKFSTGTLFIHSVSVPNGLCTLRAVSVPRDAQKPRTKIWRNVSLLEVASDVAGRCGLTLDPYSVTDRNYQALTQREQADLAFLMWLCMREGVAVKATGGKLVLFCEQVMEAKTPALTIHRDEAENSMSFVTGPSVANVQVTGAVFGKGAFTGTATDAEAVGGTRVLREMVHSTGEAERFAAGYLRAANRHRKTATIPMRQLTEAAAGSTVTLSGFGTGRDGNWFVESVTHDPVSEKSTLHLRKPLDY